jgi:high-affinity nickel-transport protein
MLIAVFFAGLRHGFDLDHIAAITDITSSQMDRRRAIVLGTVYAIGHALVLVVLGSLAVIAGQRIPASLDELMGRIIGGTLIVLGIYVVYSLIRFGRDAQLRSRWMLILAGLKRTVAWLRRAPVREVEIEHAHEHPIDGHHHRHDELWPDGPRAPVGAPEALPAPGGAVKTATHAHPHRHVVRAPADPFTEYGIGTSFGIGMIHGVGAETPSQIVLFTTAAGVTGALGGAAILAAFVIGLLLGNTILVVVSSAGFSQGRSLPGIYLALAAATAVVSLGVGLLYAVNRPDLLPAFLGG